VRCRPIWPPWRASPIEQRGNFFLDLNDQAGLVQLGAQVITLTGELDNVQGIHPCRVKLGASLLSHRGTQLGSITLFAPSAQGRGVHPNGTYISRKTLKSQA
jgi:hypothetical protein